MSAETDFDALMGDVDSDVIQSEGMKNLRKAYDKLKAEHAKLQTEVATQAKATRGASLADLLKDAGARPSIAKYFPTEGDVSKDAVTAWLKENGEDFGWQPPEATPEEQDQESAVRAVSSLTPQQAPDLRARAAALGQAPTSGRDVTQADALNAKTLADSLLGQLNLR